MKTAFGALVLTAVLSATAAGCTFHTRTARYTQEELDRAAEVVSQYYGHVQNAEFDQALRLVEPPQDLIRDWEYESNFRVRELRRMIHSGDYRLTAFQWVRSNGSITPLGPPGDLSHGKPLRFVVDFETRVQGKRTSLNEIVHVQMIDGQFRIVNFESVDHFIRFRAYSFALPRVRNAPPNERTAG